ncbi:MULTISPECIES: DHCW motif cupin fold protein [unclassified Chryseobacterium]|uniref:DHCW motif cupin fold protein n=1 Tax=unclassified Chryseobacterium TaxID=2593645 RepID=UPI001E64AD92|nr:MULTISPECIES: DHCW motif cupin fold protein [unclassified Chryseobacterium]
MSKILFQTTDWEAKEKTEHVDETGTAYCQTVQLEGLTYTENYFVDHWCQKGHIVQCLEGELINKLITGEKTFLRKRMSYIVSDGQSSHRSISERWHKIVDY